MFKRKEGKHETHRRSDVSYQLSYKDQRRTGHTAKERYKSTGHYSFRSFILQYCSFYLSDISGIYIPMYLFAIIAIVLHLLFTVEILAIVIIGNGELPN